MPIQKKPIFVKLKFHFLSRFTGPPRRPHLSKPRTRLKMTNSMCRRFSPSFYFFETGPAAVALPRWRWSEMFVPKKIPPSEMAFFFGWKNWCWSSWRIKMNRAWDFRIGKLPKMWSFGARASPKTGSFRIGKGHSSFSNARWWNKNHAKLCDEFIVSSSIF